MKRDYEIQQRALEGDWVELRLVFQTGIEPSKRAYHQVGAEARLSIAHFALMFSVSLAEAAHAHALAAALIRLWNHLHHSNCSCDKTRH